MEYLDLPYPPPPGTNFHKILYLWTFFETLSRNSRLVKLWLELWVLYMKTHIFDNVSLNFFLQIFQAKVVEEIKRI